MLSPAATAPVAWGAHTVSTMGLPGGSPPSGLQLRSDAVQAAGWSVKGIMPIRSNSLRLFNGGDRAAEADREVLQSKPGSCEVG